MLQVRWGGRNQDGAGNTVGEEVEQVCYYWHYCNYVDIRDFTDTFMWETSRVWRIKYISVSNKDLCLLEWPSEHDLNCSCNTRDSDVQQLSPPTFTFHTTTFLLVGIRTSNMPKALTSRPWLTFQPTSRTPFDTPAWWQCTIIKFHVILWKAECHSSGMP